MTAYNRRTPVNLNQLVMNIPVRRKAADQVEREKFEWSQVYNYLILFLKSWIVSSYSGKVLQKLLIVLNRQPKKNMFEVRQ